MQWERTYDLRHSRPKFTTVKYAGDVDASPKNVLGANNAAPRRPTAEP